MTTRLFRLFFAVTLAAVTAHGMESGKHMIQKCASWCPKLTYDIIAKLGYCPYKNIATAENDPGHINADITTDLKGRPILDMQGKRIAVTAVNADQLLNRIEKARYKQSPHLTQSFTAFCVKSAEYEGIKSCTYSYKPHATALRFKDLELTVTELPQGNMGFPVTPASPPLSPAEAESADDTRQDLSPLPSPGKSLRFANPEVSDVRVLPHRQTESEDE